MDRREARGGRGSGGGRSGSKTHSRLGTLRLLLPLLCHSCRGSGIQAYAWIVHGSRMLAVLGNSGEPTTGAVTSGGN